MRRKDYELLARAFKGVLHSDLAVSDYRYRHGVHIAARAIAKALKRDNKAFEERRWLGDAGAQW